MTLEEPLDPIQLAVLQYLEEGGHLNFSDGRFNWNPSKLPPYLDRRLIEGLEERGLISFRQAFASSIGGITREGSACLPRSSRNETGT